MDKKSKILLAILLLLVAGSVVLTYYRIMIKRDYLISSQVECDPYTEKCFIWNCDPESTIEGESCTGDLEADVWYYKIVKRNASRIPLCDPETDENCQPFLCEMGESECVEILCSAETATEGEICNDPEEYALNNPIREESECDSEVDEECLKEETEEDETVIESDLETEE